MRQWVAAGMYERPRWLEWVERAPPLELHNMMRKQRRIHNPYPRLVEAIVRKYPDARFQDCFVDGNDWSKGNDTYRYDHPIMQFAARQLRYMNRGMSRRVAFKKVEEELYQRRLELEKEQKVAMAVACGINVRPLYTTGQAYWQQQIADTEATHLTKIIKTLRSMRLKAAGLRYTTVVADRDRWRAAAFEEEKAKFEATMAEEALRKKELEDVEIAAICAAKEDMREEERKKRMEALLAAEGDFDVESMTSSLLPEDLEWSVADTVDEEERRIQAAAVAKKLSSIWDSRDQISWDTPDLHRRLRELEKTLEKKLAAAEQRVFPHLMELRRQAEAAKQQEEYAKELVKASAAGIVPEAKAAVVDLGEGMALPSQFFEKETPYHDLDTELLDAAEMAVMSMGKQPVMSPKSRRALQQEAKKAVKELEEIESGLERDTEESMAEPIPATEPVRPDAAKPLLDDIYQQRLAILQGTDVIAEDEVDEFLEVICHTKDKKQATNPPSFKVPQVCALPEASYAAIRKSLKSPKVPQKVPKASEVFEEPQKVPKASEVLEEPQKVPKSSEVVEPPSLSPFRTSIRANIPPSKSEMPKPELTITPPAVSPDLFAKAKRKDTEFVQKHEEVRGPLQEAAGSLRGDAMLEFEALVKLAGDAEAGKWSGSEAAQFIPNLRSPDSEPATEVTPREALAWDVPSDRTSSWDADLNLGVGSLGMPKRDEYDPVSWRSVTKARNEGTPNLEKEFDDILTELESWTKK